MRAHGHGQEERPLLPDWAPAVFWVLGPLALLSLTYVLMAEVLEMPSRVVTPVVLILVPASIAFIGVYVGGRMYKPDYAGKDGRCAAPPGQKTRCRHFQAIGGTLPGGGIRCAFLDDRTECMKARRGG